jgi:phenylalanyl-tRNA synthetase alpha subunit
MMIAEEIIAGYYKIRDFLKDARNKFLKEKTKQFKIKVKKMDVTTKPITAGEHNPITERNREITKIFTRFVIS